MTWEMCLRRFWSEVFVSCFFSFFFCREGRVGRALLFTQFHRNAQMQPSKTTPGQVEEAEGEGYTLVIPLIEKKEYTDQHGYMKSKVHQSILRYKSVENYDL